MFSLTGAVAGWQWALGKPIVDGLMAIYHGPGRAQTGPLWAAIMSESSTTSTYSGPFQIIPTHMFSPELQTFTLSCFFCFIHILIYLFSLNFSIYLC